MASENIQLARVAFEFPNCEPGDLPLIVGQVIQITKKVGQARSVAKFLH